MELGKLFHAIVVLGMGMSASACSSDPGADGGTGQDGGKDSAALPDSSPPKDAKDDVFLGWAPCY